MPNSYDPTTDPLNGVAGGATIVAKNVAAVTPSDTLDLATYARAVRVYVPATLTEASVRVTPLLASDDAATATLKFSPGAWIEPIAIRRVWATGTTAGVEIHAVVA